MDGELMRLLNIFLAFLFLSGCATVPPKALNEVKPLNKQAVVVRANPKKPTTVKLSLWERTNEGWTMLYAPTPAVIGRNGLAIAHEKKEGDGRTPSGIFPLKRAFGYLPTAETGLDYTQVTKDDLWVDDPQSPQYNQWVKAPTQARSFERLKRDDDQYKLAAVIEYNTDPVVSGDGSAIFMHIWQRYDHPTAGCVAMSERDLKKVLKRLNKGKNPVIILEQNYGY
jgi:L,D-peptidoglycan transpeptidase YkuD (ErfK/YbiS/YcfS/YnhG family)